MNLPNTVNQSLRMRINKYLYDQNDDGEPLLSRTSSSGPKNMFHSVRRIFGRWTVSYVANSESQQQREQSRTKKYAEHTHTEYVWTKKMRSDFWVLAASIIQSASPQQQQPCPLLRFWLLCGVSVLDNLYFGAQQEIIHTRGPVSSPHKNEQEEIRDCAVQTRRQVRIECYEGNGPTIRDTK